MNLNIGDRVVLNNNSVEQFRGLTGVIDDIMYRYTIGTTLIENDHPYRIKIDDEHTWFHNKYRIGTSQPMIHCMGEHLTKMGIVKKHIKKHEV